VAALVALAACDAEAAKPLLRTALADKDWAVRVRADALLRQIDPARAADAATDMRPAPTTRAAAAYRDRRVVSPPFSTAVYLDTDRGTVQIELFVLDAPLTVEHFVALARKGFFDGLAIRRSAPDFVLETGDPRGDGTGGPGYTIRSETNEQFWLRGAVGIALEGRPDTGGSRFLVADIPQPQLDGTHTVFGRVVGGMDVVDQLRDNDVVRRVRVWDGATMSSASGN
jgi:peptidyl-prolyl cis-trans isomerase B (cyclophilin B)